MDGQDALARAMQLYAAGDLARAADALRALVAQQPDNADALHLSGVVSQRLGNSALAEVLIARAVAIAPEEASFHNSLALVRQALGRYAEAEASCREALRLEPALAEAWNNLGNSLRRQGLAAEARAAYERALQLRPAMAETLYNLGAVHAEEGQTNQAQDCYRRALQLRPGHAGANNNLGALLLGLGAPEDALPFFTAALRANPRDAVAHANIGLAYRELGLVREARQAFDGALAIAPSDGTRIRRLLVTPVIGASTEELAAERRRMEQEARQIEESAPLRVGDPTAEIGVVPFYCAYQGLDDRELNSSLARIFASALATHSHTAAHCRPGARRAPGPIRVGFISRFFQDHSIAKANAGLIERLSRERFHVTVLRYPAPAGDRWASQIDRAADRVITLSPRLADAQAAIAAAALDILYYTDLGMDQHTWHLAFSRLAPVQCVTWGHSVTTGISTIDYFVSSMLLEPPGAESHYSEKLVKLPHLNTYFFRPPAPLNLKSRAELGIEERAHIYLCPQSLFKIHPDFDALLGAILRADPAGKLLISGGRHRAWQDLLAARFARSIPAEAGRIQFLPRLSDEDFRHLLLQADAVLDPLHYSGGITSLEALGLGVPIVTLPGAHMRGRQTLACYRQMNVDDLVAATPEDYVRLALRLGNEPDFRAAMRAKILAAGERLYECDAAVRELEDFLAGTIRT